MRKMNSRNQCRPRAITIALGFILLQLFFTCGASAKQVLSMNDQLKLGESMYQEGILPSGKPMQAFTKSDFSMPGISFTCTSCHLRSGLGAYEGYVYTPPTTGKELFKPLDMIYKNVVANKKIFTPILFRPAYTEKTLAEALRKGVSSNGKILNPVMPHYNLDDDDMAILITYLKNLSKDFSPGVKDTELHFATVITDDVRPEEYEAMLTPLEKYISYKNSMIHLYKKEKRSERMAATMVQSSELLYKKLSLSRWMLKGPPETWRAQLEEYNRKDPVFALLGGISNSDWKPIHDFCETYHIPCLFPQTQYPVISDTGWYTMYLSKGYYQEGETAALYLNRRFESNKSIKIIQIVRDSHQARALSKGFLQTWNELDRKAPVTITLKPKESITHELIQNLLQKEHPEAILLWDDSRALPALQLFAAEKDRPGIIMVSGGALSSSIHDIAEQSRDFTYITYPRRLPQDEGRFQVNISLFKSDPKVETAEDATLKRSFIATQMLTYALMDMKGNYYRDYFFDVIGMMPDQFFPYYERISFGPGQRYASKGCFIVQFGKGPKFEVVPKSDWVIQ
jgi:hypothetical protein